MERANCTHARKSFFSRGRGECSSVKTPQFERGSCGVVRIRGKQSFSSVSATSFIFPAAVLRCCSLGRDEIKRNALCTGPSGPVGCHCVVRLCVARSSCRSVSLSSTQHPASTSHRHIRARTCIVTTSSSQCCSR